MTSSVAMRPGLRREVGQGRPTSRVFCHVAGLGAQFPLIGLRGRGQHAGGEFAETLRPRLRDGRLAAPLSDLGGLGRAACRERAVHSVYVLVVAVTLNKKKNYHSQTKIT